MTQQIFCDGGVIGSNPSLIGGTWAVRYVIDGEVFLEKSGVTIPGAHELPGSLRYCAQVSHMPTVTNNLTEMLAVIRGLQMVPNYWAGTVYSDSQITLGRVFDGWKWTGIPTWMHREFQRERLRLTNWEKIERVLLQGHPTKADLAAGIGHKRGFPVSEHNVWCDKECGRQAVAYLALVNPAAVMV